MGENLIRLGHISPLGAEYGEEILGLKEREIQRYEAS